MSHIHMHTVEPKRIFLLLIAFFVNILLSLFEIGFGIYAQSVALIADALHNTSDAFSILIAIIAYKIGTRKANERFSYGFKRAETIGGFVNLILLFVSGCYLLYEGTVRLFFPKEVNGSVIIWVSVLALLIDSLTAKLSHHDAKHNMNMKMLFVHNLADALGSIGVIISGVFVLFLNWTFVDGLIALAIAVYMLFQALFSFPEIVSLLMNAAPENMKVYDIKQTLCKIKGVTDVHHIHVWRIDESEVSLECHIVGQDLTLIPKVEKVLKKQFGIHHCTIQLEMNKNCKACHL